MFVQSVLVHKGVKHLFPYGALVEIHSRTNGLYKLTNLVSPRSGGYQCSVSRATVKILLEKKNMIGQGIVLQIINNKCSVGLNFLYFSF